MKGLNWRRVSSLTIMLLAGVLTYTGLMLCFSPQGRVANWTDWHLLGLSKAEYEGIHLNASWLFVILGLLHTYYNWRTIVAYLKDKKRRMRVFTKDFTTALVLTVVLLAGSYFAWPPFAQVVTGGEIIKDWWAETSQPPPYTHAESSTFREYTEVIGVDTAKSLALLQAKGIRITSEAEKLEVIAKRNNTSPSQLHAILLRALEKGAAPTTSEPTSHKAGYGKLTMQQLAEEKGVEVQTLLAKPELQGARPTPDTKLKDLAAALKITPIELLPMLE